MVKTAEGQAHVRFRDAVIESLAKWNLRLDGAALPEEYMADVLGGRKQQSLKITEVDKTRRLEQAEQARDEGCAGRS